METTAERAKRLREQMGWTRAELAKRVSARGSRCSAKTIQRLEEGKKIKMRTQRAILQLLGGDKSTDGVARATTQGDEQRGAAPGVVPKQIEEEIAALQDGAWGDPQHVEASPVADGKALFNLLTEAPRDRRRVEADDAATSEDLDLVAQLLGAADVALRWEEVALPQRYRAQVGASRFLEQLLKRSWAVFVLRGLEPYPGVPVEFWKVNWATLRVLRNPVDRPGAANSSEKPVGKRRKRR